MKSAGLQQGMQLQRTTRQLTHQPPCPAHVVMMQQPTLQGSLTHFQHHNSRLAASGSAGRPHAATSALTNSRGPTSSRSNKQQQALPQPAQPQQTQHLQPLQNIPAQLASVCAAAVITLSSALAPAGLFPPVLFTPAAAHAQPRMTPEERVSVEVFKKSTPSVVNVTNLTAR